MNGLWLDENTFSAFSKPESFLLGEIATRDRAPDFYALGQFLPNPDLVLRKMGQNIRIYKELLTDSHLRSVVSSRKAGVMSMEWEIDKGKSKSRHAKFIEDVFENFDMETLLSDILGANFYGYAPLEVMWMQQGNFIVPSKVVGKPQEWFGFDTDNALRFFTRGNMVGDLVPEKKFLLPRHEPTYQNPYGFALLSACFWWVTFKKGGIKFWVTFMEKYGMPFAVGKLPAGATDKKQKDLLQKLSQMVQDAVAVIPDDASAEIIEPQGKAASAELYKSLCEFCNAEMSKAIVGQTLTTEMGSKGGSFAASKTHQEVREDLIVADKKLVEGVLNEFIAWIIDLNFGDAERPKFSLYQEEEVDQTLAERDQKLTPAMTAAGVKFTSAYFQKNYGLDEEDVEAAAPPPPPPTAPLLAGDPSQPQDKTQAPKATPQPPSPGAPPQTTPNPMSFAARPRLRVLSPHAVTLHFAKAKDAEETTFPDQSALDAAIEKLPAEELQAFADGLLKPIFTLIEKKASMQELAAGLSAAYPDMDDVAFQDALTKAIFVSDLWGRLNADA